MQYLFRFSQVTKCGLKKKSTTKYTVSIILVIFLENSVFVNNTLPQSGPRLLRFLKSEAFKQ